MDWTTVKITPDKGGRHTPFASVGFGKISLNAAACELIENEEQYSYAELLVGKKNNKKCVGVRLLKTKIQHSIPIKRKVADGKPIKGITIEHKAAIEELFSLTGVARKATRYNVEKDKDEDNVLIIYGE